MAKICNFPIDRDKRCKQPMTDAKPNCGRHRTNLAADQLGQNLTVYRKGGELHIWIDKPDSLYCLIHNNPAYQVMCQLAGETPPCCLKENIIWRNEQNEPHRDDGPAWIEANGAQWWFRHGEVHRDGDPAAIFPDGRQYWYQHDKRHRDDGPAVVEADGTQEWYQQGKRHRDDGPAFIDADGTQLWFWHGWYVTEKEHAKLREQSLGA